MKFEFTVVSSIQHFKDERLFGTKDKKFVQ